MKDSRIIRAIKRVSYWRWRADTAFTRMILKRRGEPMWKLNGTCNGCGACCTTPMIQIYPPLFYFKSIRWMIITWHRIVNGFEYIDQNRREKYFIFKCTHYDPETKLCDSYDSRPGMCRDYPTNLLYFSNPEFLDDCSYTAEYKYAEEMRDALDGLDLPEETLNELKEKLRVAESEED